MSAHAQAAAPAPARRRSQTVAFVSTHCSLRNWAEKRLYEPLVEQCNIELVFWNRGGLLSPEGLREAEEYGIGLHEFPFRPWGFGTLFGEFYPYVFRTLDRIHAAQRLDHVVCCDTDVMLPVILHRAIRGLRYQIVRHEADYYSGSRWRSDGLVDRFARWFVDGFEALMHWQCDHVLTLNRHAAARIRAWGVPGRKLVIGGLWKKDEYWSGDREGSKKVLLEKGLLTPEQYERVRGKVVASFYGFFYEFTHIRELLDVIAEFPDHFVLLTAGRGKATCRWSRNTRGAIPTSSSSAGSTRIGWRSTTRRPTSCTSR